MSNLLIMRLIVPRVHRWMLVHATNSTAAGGLHDTPLTHRNNQHADRATWTCIDTDTDMDVDMDMDMDMGTWDMDNHGNQRGGRVVIHRIQCIA
eukprot:3393249-Prymnesium_polylepis.1